MSFDNRPPLRGNLWLLLAVCASCLAGAGAAVAEPSAAPQIAETQGGETQGGETACEGGVIVDDGTAESGYGWVPSVIEGEYVQRFHSSPFPSRRLEAVCVCWIRTRDDMDIDFEVVFYADVDGAPAAAPYSAVPASATIAPQGDRGTFVGTFVEVGTGVKIPVGPSYIGVRWDASADQYFFVCTDQSPTTEPVEVFYRDDRSQGFWTSVFETSDSTFLFHRAIMVRARSSPLTVTDVPALGAAGLAALALLLGGVALAALAKRQ